MDKLDACLLHHARALSGGDGPQIIDVYVLQGLAEQLHIAMKEARQQMASGAHSRGEKAR